MPTMQEEREIPSLNTLKAVTPINTKKGPGSVGDVALKDALIIIGACWLFVFSLWFSLRSFTV